MRGLCHSLTECFSSKTPRSHVTVLISGLKMQSVYMELNLMQPNPHHFPEWYLAWLISKKHLDFCFGGNCLSPCESKPEEQKCLCGWLEAGT